MSNCLIVINRENADHNTVTEIASAVGEIGAAYVNIDDQHYVIEAAIPSHEVPTVSSMVGVCYVRTVFSYFCDKPPRRAA